VPVYFKTGLFNSLGYVGTSAKFGLHAGIYNYMPGVNHVARVYNVTDFRC